MKKPDLELVFGAGPKKPNALDDADAPDTGDDMGPEGLQQASDEVFDAIKAGDKPGFMDALKAFVKLAAMAPDDEPPPDEGAPPPEGP